MKLQDHVALVTGAAKNIGFAIGQRLAREGAIVVLNDIGPDVETAAAALREQGYEAQGIVADVSDQEQAATMVESVVSQFGRLDILVNNAAVFSDTPLLELTDSELDSVFGVNVKGTLHCAQAAARFMMRQGTGRIINIGSLAGKRGRTMYGKPGETTQVAYAASKACVFALTKAMAYEWAPHGIYVNCVSPGNVYTGRYGQAQKEALEAAIPVGHVGSPEDIAHAVAFLATPDLTFVTGETIDVDGGVLMD